MSTTRFLKKLKDGDMIKYIKKIAINIMNYRGVSRSLFIKCNTSRSIFILKVCFFRKLPEDKQGDDSSYVEIAILNEFKSSIIDGNVSPCILEMLDHGTIDNLLSFCKTKSDCIKLVTKATLDSVEEEIDLEFCKYASLIRAGLADDSCNYIALELCDITLHSFLQRKQNYSPIIVEIIRSILFQIIYTIYSIHVIYPSFRHYDLHTQNIMLLFQDDYEFNIKNIKYMRFYIGSKVAHVPYFGVIAKIIDFGYSILPEINVRSRASMDKRIMHARNENDLLFLLHHIYYAVQNNATSEAITKILEEIEPTKTHIEYFSDHMAQLKNKIPSYKEMVTCPAFSSYYNTTISRRAIWADYDGIKKYTKHKSKN